MSNFTLRRGIYCWNNKKNPLVLGIRWEQCPIIGFSHKINENFTGGINQLSPGKKKKKGYLI